MTGVIATELRFDEDAVACDAVQVWEALAPISGTAERGGKMPDAVRSRCEQIHKRCTHILTGANPDPTAVHRLLTVVSGREHNRQVRQLIDRAIERIAPHSGLHHRRHCACVHAARSDYLRRVDSALADIGHSGLWVCRSHLAKNAAPSLVVPDLRGALTLRRGLGVLGIPDHDMSRCTVTVDPEAGTGGEHEAGRAAVTIAGAGATRRPDERQIVLVFTPVAGRRAALADTLRRMRCQSRKHNRHDTAGGYVLDWPEKWLTVAEDALNGRVGHYPDCPLEWGETLRRHTLQSDASRLAVRALAPQWSGTFSELLVAAERIAQPAAGTTTH